MWTSLSTRGGLVVYAFSTRQEAVDVTENGRIEMIVGQLNRIEDKLDRMIEETHDDFGAVHSRINKVESRVTRIEAIGAFLQVVWAAIVSAVVRRW